MCWLEGALKKKKGKSLKSCHSKKKKKTKRQLKNGGLQCQGKRFNLVT